jgi:hypothetical protein
MECLELQIKSYNQPVPEFINADDWALVKGPTRWTLNNKLRPDINYWYTEGDDKVDTYKPKKGDRFYYDSLWTYDERTLSFPIDTLEIFYNAEARSKPLGAISTVMDFTPFVLQDAPLNYDDQHYSHSRQFRSNIIDEWAYWAKVINDANLPVK